MRPASPSFAIAAAVLAACQATETPEQMQARIDRESAAFRQAVEGMAPAFARYLASAAADSIAMMYTDNARVMPPNGPAVQGRDAIREMWAQMAGMGRWDITLTTVNAIANGPIGIESGTYALSLTPGPNAPPGMPTSDTGKYLVHWHMVGDRWMLAEDIWNSDMPLPPPPPARR
jgi:ketosteroid isomerase-like protein